MNNQHYERENPEFYSNKAKDITKDQLVDAREVICLLEQKMSTLENIIKSICENSNDKWVVARLEEVVHFIQTGEL